MRKGTDKQTTKKSNVYGNGFLKNKLAKAQKMCIAQAPGLARYEKVWAN